MTALVEKLTALEKKCLIFCNLFFQNKVLCLFKKEIDYLGGELVYLLQYVFHKGSIKVNAMNMLVEQLVDDFGKEKKCFNLLSSI